MPNLHACLDKALVIYLNVSNNTPIVYKLHILAPQQLLAWLDGNCVFDDTYFSSG